MENLLPILFEGLKPVFRAKDLPFIIKFTAIIRRSRTRLFIVGFLGHPGRLLSLWIQASILALKLEATCRPRLVLGLGGIRCRAGPSSVSTPFLLIIVHLLSLSIIGLLYIDRRRDDIIEGQFGRRGYRPSRYAERASVVVALVFILHLHLRSATTMVIQAYQALENSHPVFITGRTLKITVKTHVRNALSVFHFVINRCRLDSVGVWLGYLT